MGVSNRRCTYCGYSLSENENKCPYCGKELKGVAGGEHPVKMPEGAIGLSRDEEKNRRALIKRIRLVFLIVVFLLSTIAAINAYKYFMETNEATHTAAEEDVNFDTESAVEPMEADAFE